MSAAAAPDDREHPDASREEGVITLAATPIGDSQDASPRLVAALSSADLIAAEDTRRLRDLLRRLGVDTQARLISYFEGNEASRTSELIELVRAGRRLLLVTDAGMPSVSDPGFRLVTAAIGAGIRVTALPGPSAVLTALAVSGLPVDRFCFEGFLPRKPHRRRDVLAELAGEPRTMIFFEAPHRLAAALADLAGALGEDRWAAVCRELTKTYEEVKRGTLAELAAWAEAGVRGEITLVVSGAVPAVTDLAEAVELVVERQAAGVKLKPAVAEVAGLVGVAKNELYEAVLAARRVTG